MGKKREGMQRMLVIINKLKGPQQYVPRKELENYVTHRMEERDGTPVDIRTLQRDFKDIEDLFGIRICFDKKQNGYYINEEDDLKKEQYERLLLNFDLLNALDKTSNLHTYVLAEHHRPNDSECLPALIKAIKFFHPVEFSYIYVREGDKVRKKKVLPYYLKEDQQRWYLLAYDNNILKTFNIDCIRNLQILYEETFKRNMNIDANNLFKDSYGIWNQTDIPVENIELSYSALDGSFLKSIPLHHSQEIITDNEMEFRIRLRLRITNDFVMALLSRSSSLTVIEPLHLRERIRKIYEEAIKDIYNITFNIKTMNLFKALFGSSFFQQEMKRNQQYRDNYACCDDIDVNIDLAEEIENETQNEKLVLSDYIPESYLYDNENREMDDEIDLIE